MTLKSLNQQIAAALLRLASLQRRAAQLVAPQPRIVTQSLHELQNSFATLRVAYDHLQAQADELSASRAALLLERERYRELFDQAIEAYLITDAAGTIEEANRAASKLLNLSQRCLVGKPLSLFVTEGRSDFLCGLGALAVSPAPLTWTLRLRPREMAPVRVQVKGVPMRDPRTGGVMAFRWVLRRMDGESEILSREAEIEEESEIGEPEIL